MKDKEFSYKNFIVMVIIIIIWQLVYSAGKFSPVYFPSPYKIFNAFMAMIKDGSLFIHILVSLYRILVGYILAFIVSFLLAVIFYLYPNIYSYFAGILDFFKNIPPLGLIPLLILWIGIGEASKITIVFMASFFPLFLNIQKGFMVIDPDLMEMARSFNYNDREIFKHIVLPASVKDIFVGGRIALGYAYRSIIAAEMIAASNGLGYLINFSRLLSRTDKVIVVIFIIGFIGKLSDRIFLKLTGKLLKGDLKNDWY